MEMKARNVSTLHTVKTKKPGWHNVSVLTAIKADGKRLSQSAPPPLSDRFISDVAKRLKRRKWVSGEGASVSVTDKWLKRSPPGWKVSIV